MNHTTKTAIVIQRILLVLLLCISSLQLYADNYVYVCTGEGSKKYHYSEESPWMNSNCHGDKPKIKESETKRIKKYVGLCEFCAKKYTSTHSLETNPPNNTSQLFVKAKTQEKPTSGLQMKWEKTRQR